MKRVLVLLFLVSSLFSTETKFVKKSNIELKFDTDQSILNKIVSLNQELKYNKKCKVQENIEYTKNKEYPYEVDLKLSCSADEFDNMSRVKRLIQDIRNSNNVVIKKYSAETYEASEETYKNEKEFLDKHKDAVKILNRALLIQKEMEQEMQKEFQQIQQLLHQINKM